MGTSKAHASIFFVYKKKAQVQLLFDAMYWSLKREKETKNICI